MLRVAHIRSGRFTKASILQTHVRKLSTKGASRSTPAFNKAVAYIASAGVIATPSLWWFAPTSGDDVPSLESPPTQHLVFEPGPSKDEVTRLISQDAYSFPVRDVAGVNRYDGAQLASNSVCEDRFNHGKFPSPWDDGNQWLAWAVFDGHSGWQTAELLKNQLLPFVRYSLSHMSSASGKEVISNEMVQRAIMNGFVDLDNSIVKTALATSQSTGPLEDKVKKLAPAHAGSCALLSMYDSITSTLHVACTGDSRAVLGRKGPDGKWEAIPLSVDQTGHNKDEIARLNKEHPGEEGISKDGRVLGIMVSRAFGDGRWKWPLELQQDLKRRFYGLAPLTPKYDVRTPPYLTAEPVVTSTKIDSSQPSFLIMATDGMWDTVSSQQAVGLVEAWLESRTAGKTTSTPDPAYEPFDFGQFWKGVSWKFVKSRTTTVDDNVAVHLVRNSLGGNHHELVAGRLAFSSPFSRHLRDDITVQVVFFNLPDVGK